MLFQHLIDKLIRESVGMKADRKGALASGNGTSAGLVWITVAAIVALGFTFWVQSESMAQRNWPELEPVEHTEGMATQSPAPVAAAKMPERFFNGSRAANPFDKAADETQWALAEAMKPAPANGLGQAPRSNPPPTGQFGSYPWPNPVNNAPASGNVRVVQSATQQAMETMVGGAVNQFARTTNGAVSQSRDVIHQKIDQAKSHVANHAQQIVKRIPEPVTKILRPEMNDGRIRLPQVNVPAVQQAVQDRLPEQIAQLPKLQNGAAGLQSMSPIGESAAHAVQSKIREVVDGATNQAQGMVQDVVQKAIPQSIKVPDLTNGTLRLPNVSIPKAKEVGLAVRDFAGGNSTRSAPPRITLPNAPAPPSPALAERVGANRIRSQRQPNDVPSVAPQTVAPQTNYAQSAVPNLRSRTNQSPLAAPKIHIPPPPAISPTQIQPELPAARGLATDGLATHGLATHGLATSAGLPVVQSPVAVQPKLDLSNVRLPDLALPSVQRPTTSMSANQNQTASTGQTQQQQIASSANAALHVPQVAARPTSPNWQMPEFSPSAVSASQPHLSPTTQLPASQLPASQLPTSQLPTSAIPSPQPAQTPPVRPQESAPSWRMPDVPEFEVPDLSLPQIQSQPSVPALNSPLGRLQDGQRVTPQPQLASKAIGTPAVTGLPDFSAPKLLNAKSAPARQELAKSVSSAPQMRVAQNPLPQPTQEFVAPPQETVAPPPAAPPQAALAKSVLPPTVLPPTVLPPTVQTQPAIQPNGVAEGGRSSGWGGTQSVPQNGFVIPDQPIGQQSIAQQPATQQPVTQQPATQQPVTQRPAGQPSGDFVAQPSQALPAPPAATQVASVAGNSKGDLVEATRVLAMVGNQPILAGDVLGQVNQMLLQYEGKAPKEELEQQRQLLVQQALPQLVDNKLIFLDFMRDILVDKLPDLEKRVFTVFAESELPKLIEKSGVHSAKGLDAKLRQSGSSIEKQRRLFMEKAVAQQQIQSKVSFRRDVKHDEMLQFYEDNISDYHVESRAKFEHLMVRFDRFDSFDANGNFDPRIGQQKAKAAIAEMGNQVLGGAPITDVAKRSSHGPFADKGGTHDWTVKGALASEKIDDALFRLPVGKMSQVIEDEQGLHIMRVVEREPAGTIPFGEVQNKIAETIKQRRFQKGVRAYLAKLRDTTHVSTVFDDGENSGTLMAKPAGPVVR